MCYECGEDDCNCLKKQIIQIDKFKKDFKEYAEDTRKIFRKIKEQLENQK